MSDRQEARVEIGGASVHVTGDKGEQVSVGPGGVHVKDGDSEVKVSWTGIRVRDGRTNINITVWKPMLGCGIAILFFAALLTAVVVGVAKLMLR